jgi:hypothetical protein
VETPILKTNEIEYMGYDLPLYDTVTKEMVSLPEDKKKEIGKSSSYQNKQCNYLRIMPYSTIIDEIGLFSLTSLTLDFVARDSNAVDEFIVLFVYGYSNNQYVYLGHSENVYYNQKTDYTLTFEFDDVSLYDASMNEVKQYNTIYIRPRVVTVNSQGVITGGLKDTSWDSSNNTTLRIKGCNDTNVMYDPYVISNGTDNITPHITIGYRKSAYVPETKIPHNLNGEVHLTQEDKERIRQLSNLSEVVLAEEQYLIKQVDTSTASEYAKTGNDILVMIFDKELSYPLYQAWCNRELE